MLKLKYNNKITYIYKLDSKTVFINSYKHIIEKFMKSGKILICAVVINCNFSVYPMK